MLQLDSKFETGLVETRTAMQTFDDEQQARMREVNNRCDILNRLIEGAEQKADSNLDVATEQLRTLLKEKYPTNDDVRTANEYLQADINEKAEWIERAERSLLNRIEAETNALRQDTTRLDVYDATNLLLSCFPAKPASRPSLRR